MSDWIEFRNAQREDTPLILAFIRELADYEHMLDEVVADEQTLKTWIFDKEKAEVIFAMVDGREIGFALFFHNFSTFKGQRGLYLEELFIEQEHRGKGYGKALLLHLVQIAVERKCRRMDWLVLDWNAPSIAFYKSLGAIPLDDWTVFRLTETQLHRLIEQ